MGDNCVYPGVSRSFVKSGCNAELGGDSFETGEVIAGEGLLCVCGMGHNRVSLLLGTEKALLITSPGAFSIFIMREKVHTVN